jgi:hypothetical protein
MVWGNYKTPFRLAGKKKNGCLITETTALVIKSQNYLSQ